MALAKQISQIEIEGVTTSWLYGFTTQNLEVELTQVNYGSAFDEAVDGSLRNNFRGWRASIEVSYDAFIKGTVTGSGNTFEEFMDDIYTSFVTDGDDYIKVSLDGLNDIQMVLEDMSVLTRYRNQIGVASGSMRFIGRSIITSIPFHLQSS